MVPKRKKIAMYVAMIIITAIVVFPFLWMVLLSFKSSSEIMSNPLAMPKAFNLDNIKLSTIICEHFCCMYIICCVGAYYYILQLFRNCKNGI